MSDISDSALFSPNPTVAIPFPQVRQEPYSLPDGFKWDTLHLDDPLVLKEVGSLLLLSGFSSFSCSCSLDSAPCPAPALTDAGSTPPLQVYVLLNENYVEDDDNMFRFDYRWSINSGYLCSSCVFCC